MILGQTPQPSQQDWDPSTEVFMVHRGGQEVAVGEEFVGHIG